MAVIPFDKFEPLTGEMYACIFENRFIGLAPTLFYELRIPLKPFDSGIEWEENPVETEFQLRSLDLPVRDWRLLAGQTFELEEQQSDASIYLGTAHNPVIIERLRFTQLQDLQFDVECKLYCDFEFERVGNSGRLEFTSKVWFKGLWLDLDEELTPAELRAIVTELADPTAYQLSEAVLVNHGLVPPVQAN
jgi:hypothetical protein